jgi:hypothetical protein
MGKKTKKVRGIIGRIRKAEADLVKAPIVEGANYLGPPPLFVDHPLGLGRRRAGTGIGLAKKKTGDPQTPEKPDGVNPRAAIKRIIADKAKEIGVDPKDLTGLGMADIGKAVEKMNQAATAKAAIEEKPAGTGIGLASPQKAFTAGDEKGQQPLFGDHDMIVNALEMEEKSIQAEINHGYDRISSIQRAIDGLQDRLGMVHRANIRAKRLADDAQAAKAKEAAKPGKPAKAKPKDKAKDGLGTRRGVICPTADPPKPGKVTAKMWLGSPAKPKAKEAEPKPAEDPGK